MPSETRDALPTDNQNFQAFQDGERLPLRMQSLDTEFSRQLRKWSQDLDVLRQNWLLSESAFLSFARDRGLAVAGVIKGEPGKLHRNGFLSADGRSGKDLLFHPFRFHVLQQALVVGDHMTPEKARQWNSTAELAILLEPLYWPEIVGHRRYQPEEDRAFGRWTPGARARLFGSERPYDDPLRSKGFIAYQFGLFTGSALRWYVEGETEYYAILHILEKPSKLGVELVHLRGEISVEKRNAARKLEDALKEDLALRRFSVISFDHDLEPNVRAIRAQILQGHVVGLIDANDPDFEFANFSLDELVEVAARMDDQLGLDGGKLRRADWQGIRGARAFADHYSKISDWRSSPKGKIWGEALGAWALEHPSEPRTGAERPLLRMISAAFWAWHSNYESQRDRFEIDPQTFESRPRRQP